MKKLVLFALAILCASISAGAQGNVTQPIVYTATTGGGLVKGGTIAAPSFGMIRTCGANEILKWNGSAWACAVDAGGFDTAGTGLTSTGTTVNVIAGSGIIANANDVAIDPTYTQRRVTGTCSGNDSILSIAQDGTVTCASGTGDILSVAAGNGLTGGGTSGALTLDITASSDFAVGADLLDLSTTVTAPGSLTVATTLGVTGLSTLTGGFTLGADSSANSHKITSLTNGSSAQDAAAFGQIASGVNTAVSGTSGTTTRFTGTNTVGNAWPLDDLTTWGVASKFTINEGTGAFRTFSTATVDGVSTLTGLVTATAGVTTPANLTTTGTGQLVVAGNGSVGGTLNSVGNLTENSVRVITLAGTGLSKGGTTLTVNVAGASCSAGSFVSAVSATGTGTCTAEPGDIAGVTAGVNLSGGGTSGTVTLDVVASPSFAGNMTAGDATTDVQTLNGATTINGPAAGVGLDVRAPYAIAGANTEQLRVSESGSYRGSFGYDEAGGTTLVLDNSFADPTSSMSFRFGNTEVTKILGNGTVSSATFVAATALNSLGTLTVNGNATLGDTTSDSATIYGVTTSSEAVGNVVDGSEKNLLLIDTTSEAAGVGGAISFGGSYTGTTSTTGGLIKSAKTNGTDGQYGFDLSFYTRINGGSLGRALKLDSTQGATFDGTLAVNGTFDSNTDLSKFGTTDGGTYIHGDTINGDYSVNGAGTLYANYFGYNDGSTQFRDFDVRDGKGAQVALFAGSTKAVTLAGALTVTGVADFNNSLTKFGSTDGETYINDRLINFGYAQNATYDGYINYVGYNNGATQFRNLIIADGKNATVATFTGSTKAVDLAGALTTAGNTTLGDATSDTTTINGATTISCAGTSATCLGIGAAGFVAYFTGDNTFNFAQGTNAAATTYFSYYGYNNANAQYRSIEIDNGKALPIALFTGAATNSLTLGGSTTAFHLIDIDTSQRPTVGSGGANCGTAASLVGNDHSGVVTVGSGGASACTVTLHTALSANGSCRAWLRGAASTYAITGAVTGVTITAALGAGVKFDYQCEDH